VKWFFILSGLGIALSCRKWRGAKEFYAKRVCAVLAPFWVAYIAVSLYHFVMSGRRIFPVPGGSFMASMAGMDGWFLSMRGASRFSGGYLVGEWYLGCLMLIYLAYPLVRKIMDKNKILAMRGVL
jgi:peptidoglycan/LPS O-acetylase OafA/YrhL